MKKLWAKKSLGQHFLNSSHVLSQIIEASHLQEGDTVLEIGPGTGILTKALLSKGANVIAVEKDTRAIEGLQVIAKEFGAENGANNRKLSVIEGDILALDISSLIKGPYSVVANIPYYITGAILEKFLEHEPRPTKMVLLVQYEVADRILTRDGKESILSMSVKVFGQPKMIAKVPRGAFTPPPSVESAILSIEDISGKLFGGNNLMVKDTNNSERIDRFFKILKAGFAHKRKFAKKNIETSGVITKDEINQIWLDLGLDEKVRAEDMKLEDWLNIASQ